MSRSSHLKFPSKPANDRGTSLHVFRRLARAASGSRDYFLPCAWAHSLLPHMFPGLYVGHGLQGHDLEVGFEDQAIAKEAIRSSVHFSMMRRTRSAGKNGLQESGELHLSAWRLRVS